MSIVNPGTCTVEIAQQQLELHPLRGAYWIEQQVLLLSDLHLGKAAHFRRAGIPTPKGIEDSNFDRLISLLLTYHPKRVLLLGDLFHSDYNTAWEDFADLVRQFKTVSFELVPGNHDILDEQRYLQADLTIHPLSYREGSFLFTHHPVEEPSNEVYNLAGHIHPGVSLRGRGRQSLRLPCFYFGAEQGILPAFGAFTGLANVPIGEADRVFGITPERVVALHEG